MFTNTLLYLSLICLIFKSKFRLFLHTKKKCLNLDLSLAYLLNKQIKTSIFQAKLKLFINNLVHL